MQDNEFEAFHRSLIQQCAAKVVLLCGPRAESAIKAVMTSPSRYTLELQGFTYSMYLEKAGASAQKLYIRCPELPRRSGPSIQCTPLG